MSHQHEHEEDEAQLNDEDIVEIHEDDDIEGHFEPMEEGYESDGDDAKYDGEIIIGAPGPGEDMDMDGEGGEGEEELREDNSWGVSALHAAQQSIFAISLHPSFPNPPLAISGGEDDDGFLYCPIPESSGSAFNSETFKAVKLTGHGDSVVAVGWNFDGEMVATGGMDGRVRVWRRVKGRKGTPPADASANSANPNDWKDWEFLTSLETGSEIQWITWHPKGNVLSAGCEDSSVWLWNLPSGNTMTVLSSHTLPATCGIFPPPNGRQLLTSSLDSSLILWDVQSSTPIFKTSVFCPPNSPEIDPSVHGITAMAVSPDGRIAAVGGANGLVKIVGLEKGNVVTTLRGHAEGESVEALVFIDVLGGAGGGKGVVLVSAGTDGKGFVWDVNTGRVRSELQHDEPITSLAPHPSPHLHLCTSASADGSLKTWDVRTGALIASHRGHAGVVNGVAVAPAPEGSDAKEVVVSAGDEGVSLIWKV